MNDINALTQVDYIAVFISVMTILIGVLSIKKIIESFYKWFGLETKWMREKREQRELLLKTAEKVCDLEGRQDEFAQDKKRVRKRKEIKLCLRTLCLTFARWLAVCELLG